MMDAYGLRKADATDAPAIAAIHRSARLDALPFLPHLFTPDQVLAFFRGVVLQKCEVWVGTFDNGTVVGFCALHEGWIEHLYIEPKHQRRGLGTRLLRRAMLREPSLRLWAFQRNVPARRFYEKHGFVVVKETDGANNQEREPDVLYAWSRPHDS